MTTITGILKFGKSIELRPAALYTFSDLLSKGVSFLLLFYFANTLSETDYGLFSLCGTGILFLTPFISAGILQSVNTVYSKNDKKDFNSFFSTTLLKAMLVTLVAMGLLFIVKLQIQQRHTLPVVFVFLIPLVTFFRFLTSHVKNMVRNGNHPVKYLFITIGMLLAKVTLAVFLTGVMEWGLMGSITGIFIAYLMLAGYAFFYFKEEGFITNSLSKKIMYDELLKNVPATAIHTAMFIMGPSAVFFVAYFMHDFVQAGILSITATSGSAIIMLSVAMYRYASPKVNSLLAEKNTDYAAIRWHLFFYAGVMLLGTGAVIIATPLAFNIVLKQSYHEGLYYYVLICLGYFFWSISYFLYAFLLYNKEKRKLLTALSVSVLISLLSHTLFVKQWGAYGAAVSMCIVYFIALLTTMFFVRKQLSQILSNKLSKAVLS